jgi:hypothetical protein
MIRRLATVAGLQFFVAIALITVGGPARALEALDGRVEVHGFFESQMRVISDDFSGDYDLAQWQQVLNIEVEVDVLPDGWGYIDLLQAYVRIEGRYDCIYTRGCGMFRGVNTYGDKAKHLPQRLANGHTSTYSGAIKLDGIDSKQNRFVDTNGDGVADSTRQTTSRTVFGQRIVPNRKPITLAEAPGFSGLAAQTGADGYIGTPPFGNALNGLAVAATEVGGRGTGAGGVRPVLLNGVLTPTPPGPLPDPAYPSAAPDQGGDWALRDDDPFPVIFDRFDDFRFAHRGLRGGAAGGLPVAVMGPWLPKNFIYPNATLADIGNPFDATVTPQNLKNAAYNGSIYNGNLVYGTNFSAGGINPENTLSYFENNLLAVTSRPSVFGGVPYSSVFNAAELSASDTSIESNARGAVGLLLPFWNGVIPGTSQRVWQTEGIPIFGLDTLDFAIANPDAWPVDGIASSISPTRRSTAKPMRSIPIEDAGDFAVGNTTARGLYLPSRGLRKAIASGKLNELGVLNMNERDRTWNRGSGQDEGELKEAYIDLETLDSRLWLRIGKQNIVWGKTELFRTTDQFNPVDLALYPLGNLEETRIALWSARAVLSLYEIGPFDDVRVEFAANIDEFEPNDLGACGEPFALNPVCDAAFGVFAHGAFGTGLAGAKAPPSPWEDVRGIEFGARIEWRWDRFSFALADFYGYEDLPYLERISTYERNVDPETGRMRAMGMYGPCRTQPLALRTEAESGVLPDVDDSCLQAGPTRRDNKDLQLLGGIGLNTYLADSALLPLGADGQPIPELPGHPGVYAGTNPTDPTYSPNNSLDASPVNQQFFAAICAGTVGVSALDPAACAGTIFGSQQALPILQDFYRLAPIIGATLGGSFFTYCENADLAVDTFCVPRTAPNPRDVPAVIRPEVGFGATLIGDSGEPQPSGGRTFATTLVALNRDPFDAEYGGSGVWGQWITAQDQFASGRFLPGDTVVYGGANAGCVDNALLDKVQRTRNGVVGDATGNELIFNEGTPVPCHSGGSVGLGLRATGGQLQVANGGSGLPIYLTVEQQALLGCGPFFGTNCSDSGIDLMNAEASVLFQAFPGFEGTGNPSGGANFRAGVPGASLPQQWTTTNRKYDGSIYGRRLADDGQDRMQPGTIFFRGGPVGTIVDRATGAQTVLPGTRSPFVLNADGTLDTSTFNERSDNPVDPYSAQTDGCVGGPELFVDVLGYESAPEHCNERYEDNGDPYDDPGSPKVPLHALKHPLVTNSTIGIGGGQFGIGGSDQDQYFRSEMAALSHNFLMLLAVNDGLFYKDRPFAICEELVVDGSNTGMCDLDSAGEPIPVCSFATPQHCATVRGLLGLAGLTRNTLRAGGDGTFGRRTFVWQSGGEAWLSFARRNVLGFSGDFAEDVTKSNFSLEATWIKGVPRGSRNSYSGVRKADDYNVTLSIDRPTFVNFLNANRTFFFNTQWFFRYRDYKNAGGRWDMLGTFTILAGYFQDRLLPNVTFVYDVRSKSASVLPQIQYRYTEAFSIIVGAQFFSGRPQMKPIPVNGLGPASNQQGRYAYQAANDVGLSILRKTDNLYVRLRYSF